MITKRGVMRSGVTALLIGLWVAPGSHAEGSLQHNGATLWVDAASTAARQDGSQAAPFQTVAAALSSAPKGCTVRVREGEYVENLIVADGVTLIGYGERRPVIRAAEGKQPTLRMSGASGLEFFRVTNGSDGIIVGCDADVRIARCEIVNNSGDGIHPENPAETGGPATIDVEDCLVSGNRDGIDLASTRGLVRNCRLIGNKDDGLDYDGDTDCDAAENEIRDNADDGIEIRLRWKTRAQIKNNVITGNGEDGIEVINTPVNGETVNRLAIGKNKISGNRRYGIAGVEHGTEDIREGVLIEGVALEDNRVEGNLRGQVGGFAPARAADARRPSEDTGVGEPPVTKVKPQYGAFLTGSGAGIALVELDYTVADGRIVKKRFQVAVQGGPAGATWEITVDGVVVGKITLGAGGGMEIEWATKHGSFPAEFPEGAGAGSVVSLGNMLTGKLKPLGEVASDPLAERWKALSPVGSKAPPESKTKRQWIAYLSGPAGTGRARLDYTEVDGRTVKREFEVLVTGGPPGADWEVSVDGIVIGRITLGAGGGREMEWSTKYGSFPAGFPEAGVGSRVSLGGHLSGTLEPRTGDPQAAGQPDEPPPALGSKIPTDEGARGTSPEVADRSEAPSDRGAGQAGPERGSLADHPNWWGVESPPLETETARVALPGTLKLDFGFEREAASNWTHYHVPFALEYWARRVGFRIEPIVYSKVRERGTRATGLGDLEMTVTVVALPERRGVPGVAFAAEAILPTASSRHLGSGEADYTGDLILSKRLGSLDAHVNLGYTLVGPRESVRTQNVFSFSFSAERRFSRFDAVAEIIGHTSALAGGGDPDALGVESAEIAGEELVATLGGRYRVNDRVALSTGISYDNDHALHVHPGLSLRLR